MDKLEAFVSETVGPQLKTLILSDPVSGSVYRKLKLRPVSLSGEVMYQAEQFTGTQVFHKNLDAAGAGTLVKDLLTGSFRQAQAQTGDARYTVLVSKKGTVTVKKTRTAPQGSLGSVPEDECSPARISLPSSHNRRKNYILEEGRPVPFLVDLGVMTPEGKIVQARYDKFRQINRFLEFIADVLPDLVSAQDQEGEEAHIPKRQLRILDFGCGKSYLTFAVYYYLHEIMGFDVRITGLDLKEDVIRHCQELALKYGYDGLEFQCGDVAFYDGRDNIDMMLTLHACDTATDYALARAVRLKAKVILSVPCCQHELNGQIENDLLAPILSYGIVKERIAALMTDTLRAELLKENGYRTQLLEFIDMEHTPKNLLIRAVLKGKKAENHSQIEAVLDSFHLNPALYRLLKEK